SSTVSAIPARRCPSPIANWCRRWREAKPTICESGESTSEEAMYKASAGIALPTSIIGSLPRPAWYTAVLGGKSFLEAMVNSRYREQYEDAVSCFLRAQEVAGLDILTDGDAHYDEEV